MITSLLINSFLESFTKVGEIVQALIKNEKAFTLLEVMIAGLIFCIVLIPMMSLYVQSFRVSHQSGDQLTALNLAQGIIEEYKAADFTQIHELVKEPVGSDYPNYQYSLNIENAEEAINFAPMMIKITVSVYFSSGGREDKLVLSTLKLKRWNSEQ